MPLLVSLITEWEKDGSLPEGSLVEVKRILSTLSTQIHEGENILFRFPLIGKLTKKRKYANRKKELLAVTPRTDDTDSL